MLICDDQPFLRAVLSRTIKESWPNTEIVEVDSGKAGERVLEEQKEQGFDVIFMDIEMPPGQNGLETIKNIRERKLAEGIPIVICTGCKGETDMGEGWQDIAQYTIGKPFEPDEIDEILDEVKWKGYA